MFNADESLAMDVPMYHRKEIYPSTHVLQFLIWVIPVFASISPVLHPLMHQPPSYTYKSFGKQSIILLCLVLLSSAWMENNPIETLWIFFFPTKIHVHSQLTDIVNPHRPKISIIREFSHEKWKKILNNISQSGKNHMTRKL